MRNTWSCFTVRSCGSKLWFCLITTKSQNAPCGVLNPAAVSGSGPSDATLHRLNLGSSGQNTAPTAHALLSDALYMVSSNNFDCLCLDELSILIKRNAARDWFLFKWRNWFLNLTWINNFMLRLEYKINRKNRVVACFKRTADTKVFAYPTFLVTRWKRKKFFETTK